MLNMNAFDEHLYENMGLEHELCTDGKMFVFPCFDYMISLKQT